MLLVTDAAADVVKSVLSTPQAPEGAGLRIASVAEAEEPADPDTFQLTAVTGPAADDQVIVADGARVFLEPQAAEYLDDKVLDAQVDEESGEARFSLAPQAR